MEPAARKRAMRIGLATALALVACGGDVYAENGGGLLTFLFGGKSQEAPAPAPVPDRPASGRTGRIGPASTPHKIVRKKIVRDFVPLSETRAPGAIGGAPAPVTATFFVDVLGDSLGIEAADGLTQAYAARPDVSVISKASDASGLTRPDYFDWPKTAGDLVKIKDKLDFVVIMLGINDVQPMPDGAKNLDVMTDPWRDSYAKRIEAMVTPFHDAHVPVVWVGLPPMRSDGFNANVVKLNAMFKEHAEKAGAKYIDVWDAFADPSGQYAAFGPDVDGQNAKLRGGDGIHLTKAGSRKAAHFVESEIKRVLDKTKPPDEVSTLPPDIQQTANDINAQIRLETGAGPKTPETGESRAPKKPPAGPILSLTARPASPGGALLGKTALAGLQSEVQAKILRSGDPVDPRPGRADDFAWPRL